MSKHSPSPWRETGNIHEETVTEHQMCWIHDATGRTVATVYCIEEDDPELIRSAPELRAERDQLRIENARLEAEVEVAWGDCADGLSCDSCSKCYDRLEAENADLRARAGKAEAQLAALQEAFLRGLEVKP